MKATLTCWWAEADKEAVPNAVTHPATYLFWRPALTFLFFSSFYIAAVMPTDVVGPTAVKHKKTKKVKVIETDLGLADLSLKEKQKKHKANSLSHELSIPK